MEFRNVALWQEHHFIVVSFTVTEISSYSCNTYMFQNGCFSDTRNTHEKQYCQLSLLSATSTNNVWSEQQLSTYKHSGIVPSFKTFIEKNQILKSERTLCQDLVPNYGKRYQPSCAHFQNTNSNLIFVRHIAWYIGD